MKRLFLYALVLASFLIAGIPGHSEAGLESFSFSGSVDFIYGLPEYPAYSNSYDGRMFALGKAMTGYVEYDPTGSETTKLWMDVFDQSDAVYRFSAIGSGVYNYDSYVKGAHVFEIQGDDATLTNLILTVFDIAPGSTGTWYFDYDNTEAFRIGGSAQVVPIPAAVWLLGTGIIGLAALRKKVQK